MAIPKIRKAYGRLALAIGAKKKVLVKVYEKV